MQVYKQSLCHFIFDQYSTKIISYRYHYNFNFFNKYTKYQGRTSVKNNHAFKIDTS